MKPNQYIKGHRISQNTPIDIESTYNAPIIAIQNQGSGDVTVTLNNGEPMTFSASPFVWEPYVPLLGTIETDGTDVVVWI
ncbi:hypothetical protein NVP1197A_14 [Vibrio phage 1.197.A._10N.286.54.F2]|nr:hypothetical protein NVP1197A_14 [Vibrio phage 1.197.A._10N.286.54.F2]